MATELRPPLLPPPPPTQRQRRPRSAALAISATALLLPLLIATFGRRSIACCSTGSETRSSPPNDDDPVELTLVTAAQEKGADFYNWNRVYVMYCDGASFSGDSQLEDGNSTLFFRGQRIWEAVLDELMQKGLACSKQALLTGCSAGGLATLLHCDDFRARFPPEVSVKCLPDAGFFLDAKDLSGRRSMWSVFNGVVHLQNVSKVLPKDCLLVNKDPTECFFPTELIKSISTPTLIVNSAYDSYQVRFVIAPDGSTSDESWRSCKADVQKCNSSQIKVLNAFRKAMVDDLEAVKDNINRSWFIDSCFTHCQTIFDNSGWNSPVAPILGNNKTLMEVIGDWYFGRSPSLVAREVGCEYPCNPTCNRQSDTSDHLVQQSSSARIEE